MQSSLKETSSKPEVSEYNKQEEEMKRFDPCLFLTDDWCRATNINEQMGALMKEKKGYAAAFDQLMSEKRNVTGCTNWTFLGQRGEMKHEIQAKIAERQELT